MRSKRGPLGLLVLAAALFAMAFSASAALADTGDVLEQQFEEAPDRDKSGFQAGTCDEDLVWPNQCSPETPEIFFEQAAGHPPIGFTQYIVKHQEIAPNLLEETEAVPKAIRVELPVGLTVNPQATDQCELAVFEENPAECPPGSQVGREEVTVSVQVGGVIEFPPMSGEFLPKNAVLPPNPALNTLVPIYNLVPKFGEPALFGFKIGSANAEVFLEGDVDWAGDYHQGFTIKLPPPNPLVHTLRSRLVNFGTAGNGTYITNPTTCFDPDTGAYSTFIRAQGNEPDEAELPFPEAFSFQEAKIPPGVEQEGCEEIPFEPSLDVNPGTNATGSPAAAEVTVELPYRPGVDPLEQSHVKDAEITFPEGMGLNPSAANFVSTCTNSQFGKGTEDEVECPSSSKIGTVEVETQPLPPGSLEGDVYLGQQLGFDPESGNMYRIFINPVSERFGVDVRLIANIVANRQTGRLTAKLLDNPQVPFESVKLNLDAAKRTLTSPPTCDDNVTDSRQVPWSTPDSTAFPSSAFELSTAGYGGDCPDTLAERRFAPGYFAAPEGTKAGAFSPFRFNLFRADGEQEVKRIDVDLPPGMIARLRGLEYCPEANIDAARSRSGAGTAAAPPCPNKSYVGAAIVAAGSGPQPYRAPGNVYFAGPYKGAPLSLVFVTPALAGPYDLGTVVVRVALFVDPETVTVHAVSDEIPDVFGGVKLSIQGISVGLERPKFTLNPTTCRREFQIRSRIFGGGGNPANPALWQPFDARTGFTASKCKALQFKPKFYARIFGGKNQMRRAKNPKFRAILDARDGDANLRRAAFILPRATILDQSHIRTICTRVQLAANSCPKGSIYGNARATSPLLDEPLKGPVYLTSSDNELPDLLVDLRGQVNVRLRGIISGKNARLKTVFNKAPDVAVNKFILTMKGGDRGLLINSRNLCARQTTGFLNLLAQNSRRMRDKNLRLNIPACRGGRNR